MRNPDFLHICGKKGADPGHKAAAQLLSAIIVKSIRHFKPLTIFCGCTAPFVSDPERGFTVAGLIYL